MVPWDGEWLPSTFNRPAALCTQVLAAMQLRAEGYIVLRVRHGTFH
jgi:hypothetical protein